VKALQTWLRVARIGEGAVFREVSRHGRVGESALTGRSVARIVKRGVATIGLDPAYFGGHSLRAGLPTAAAREGSTELAIMRQTRHVSVDMVRRYIREADLFRGNAAKGLL
jgi:integrase